MSEEPPKPFASDGCSMFPNGNWNDCCVEHDRAYWRGGSAAGRKAADRALRDCVAKKGHPIIARLMYFGVRAGGAPWYPAPYRGGFGWPWPQRITYSASQSEE